MKTTKTNRRRVAAAALVGMLAAAAPGFAWMGGWSGYGMGPATAVPSLTAEQQKNFDEVQKKYQPQLNELEQKLNAKSSELATARANDSTTVAQLNSLESDLYQLERRYWTLLDQANVETAQVTGTGFGSYFTCGYMGGNHQHYRGRMMPGGSMTCCW